MSVSWRDGAGAGSERQGNGGADGIQARLEALERRMAALEGTVRGRTRIVITVADTSPDEIQPARLCLPSITRQAQ